MPTSFGYHFSSEEMDLVERMMQLDFSEFNFDPRCVLQIRSFHIEMSIEKFFRNSKPLTEPETIVADGDAADNRQKIKSNLRVSNGKERTSNSESNKLVASPADFMFELRFTMGAQQNRFVFEEVDHEKTYTGSGLNGCFWLRDGCQLGTCANRRCA